jgi:hypothetical protein
MGHSVVHRRVGLALLLIGLLGHRAASAQAPVDQDQGRAETTLPPPGGAATRAAPAAVDGEEPPRPRSRAAVSPPVSPGVRRGDGDEDDRPPRKPVWGLMFVFGFGGGGDDLVTMRRFSTPPTLDGAQLPVG